MLGSELFTNLFFFFLNLDIISSIFRLEAERKEFVAVDLCAPVILVAFQTPEPMEIQIPITIPMYSENKVIKE